MALVADVLRREGARWYGVNALDEGIALRGLVDETSRIVVLGYVVPERFAEALAHDLDVVLTNPDELDVLDRVARDTGRRGRVHVKVETGTHRRGMVAADLDALVPLAARLERVDLEGIATHFANIEDTLEHDYAESQLRRFHAVADDLAKRGVRFRYRHVACTAASLLFPQTSLELSRVGIGLYGLWPSRETWVSYRNVRRDPVELRPCLRWVTRVTQVKDVPRGAFVGYGRTYRMTADGRLAVLPVGYHEGYDRHLSNVAHVLVGGQRAPVRGRVCMNMILVDVSHIPDVAVGHEAVLLGSQGTETVTADDLAGWAGTINYEIVTRIHPELPRVAVSGDARRHG
jgi:alanine racemase